MNKTKILAFIAISAMLFACGSQEQDGSPAKLKNGGRMGTISPFDTLKAEFDAEIVNIDKLDTANIKIFQDMSLAFPEGRTTSNILHFIGSKDITGSGLKHFEHDKNDSIVFLNLQNKDGYVQSRAVLYYSTYPILDSQGNNETPDNIEQALGRNALTTKGVTFAGVVGVKDSPEWVDINDYFELTTFKAFDSLFVTLNDATVNLMLITPKPDTIRSEIKNKTKSIEYEIDPRGIVSDTKLPIRLKIRVSSSGNVTPYLLTVRVVECPECRTEQ